MDVIVSLFGCTVNKSHFLSPLVTVGAAKLTKTEILRIITLTEAALCPTVFK